MLRTLVSAGMLIAASLSSGCASIVNGQNQPISVDTPDCSAASCQLTNDKGTWFVTTPGSVTVRRSFGSMTVACTRAGYVPVSTIVDSRTKAMAFGNIIFGGAIGAGIDIGTGAAYDYPELITVPLLCGSGAVSKTTSPAGTIGALPESPSMTSDTRAK